MQIREGLIDFSAVEELRELSDGDPGWLKEFISSFSVTAPLRIRDLEASLERGDFSGIRKEAHSLKSSCAYVGAREMSELCKVIESLSEQRAKKELRYVTKALARSWRETEPHLVEVSAR